MFYTDLMMEGIQPHYDAVSDSNKLYGCKGGSWIGAVMAMFSHKDGMDV
jgi:hypothetical protein